ncbi:hypothetical protein LCGC14_2832380, partial [marine sediment metagenome]
MADLRDYLGREALRQLAAMFSDAAQRPVRISSADGEPIAGDGPASAAGAEMKVLLADRHIGTVSMVDESGPADPHSIRLLGLMRDMLGRLCQQAGQLHDRVEELAAMYRLTEVFTGRTDLQEVHQLAADTMVEATGADACSIRVFDESRTELLRVAASGLSSQYITKGRLLLSDSRIDREVLATGGCVYIADQRTDPRVLYKADARQEGIVSALCAPMTYMGRIEGIVRVYTRRPHEFDWFETSLIQGVAAQSASAIVNARLYNEAMLAERMRRHLRMAGEVQRRMIPPQPPEVAGLDIAAVYVPCYELGGDFYDFLELPEGNLGVCVADVVGKGVRASLLMASARSSLRAHAAHLYELSAIVSAVSDDMWRQSRESDFLT